MVNVRYDASEGGVMKGDRSGRVAEVCGSSPKEVGSDPLFFFFFFLHLNLYPATVLLNRQGAAGLCRSYVKVYEGGWPEGEPKLPGLATPRASRW